MAEFKVVGTFAQARIVTTDDGEGWTFTCSNGAWCDAASEQDRTSSFEDAAMAAEVHIDKHDAYAG